MGRNPLPSTTRTSTVAVSDSSTATDVGGSPSTAATSRPCASAASVPTGTRTALGHRGVATLHHDPEAGSGQCEPRRGRCSQAPPGPLDDDPRGAGMPGLQQGAREEPLDRLVALGLLDDRHLGRTGPKRQHGEHLATDLLRAQSLADQGEQVTGVLVRDRGAGHRPEAREQLADRLLVCREPAQDAVEDERERRRVRRVRRAGHRADRVEQAGPREPVHLHGGVDLDPQQDLDRALGTNRTRGTVDVLELERRDRRQEEVPRQDELGHVAGVAAHADEHVAHRGTIPITHLEQHRDLPELLDRQLPGCRREHRRVRRRLLLHAVAREHEARSDRRDDHDDRDEAHQPPRERVDVLVGHRGTAIRGRRRGRASRSGAPRRPGRGSGWARRASPVPGRRSTRWRGQEPRRGSRSRWAGQGP